VRRRGGTHRDVNHLQPKGVSHQVVGQDDGALQAGVGPFGLVRVCDKEAGDGNGVDLVVGLGDHALDRLLVLFVEDGRHGGGGFGGLDGGKREDVRRIGGWIPVVVFSRLDLQLPGSPV
jgi:hypothetical protein